MANLFAFRKTADRVLHPIVSGLALADTRMILSGAISAALLALLVDGALGLVERAVRPGGVDDSVTERTGTP